MSTATIDIESLNQLFEKQKKLDKLFDSVFDDEKYFIDISAPSAVVANSYADFDFDNEFSYSSGSRLKDSLSAIRNNPSYCMLLVVSELALIYWVVSRFS